MDAITAITQRVSVAQLTGPGPTDQQLQQMYQGAFRAPDHAWMRPWRYLTIKNEGLANLGEIFAQASLQDDPSLTEQQLAKIQSKHTEYCLRPRLRSNLAHRKYGLPPLCKKIFRFVETRRHFRFYLFGPCKL